MIKFLTNFFKRWNYDWLDDDRLLENIDSGFIKANPSKDEDSRKLFVDFADYDHFPTTEDIESIKAKKHILNCVLPDRQEEEL